MDLWVTLLTGFCSASCTSSAQDTRLPNNSGSFAIFVLMAGGLWRGFIHSFSGSCCYGIEVLVVRGGSRSGTAI